MPPLISIEYGEGCDDNGEMKAGTIDIIIRGEPDDEEFSISIEYTDFVYKNKTWNGTKEIDNVTGDEEPEFGEDNQMYLEFIDMQFSTEKHWQTIKSSTES